MNTCVLEDADRGVAPPSDEKARFTTLETGLAYGDMAPSFHIIKCDSKSPNDLSQARVIHRLDEKSCFDVADRWEELKKWDRTMALEEKVKKETTKYSVTFKRQYMFHVERLHVITCQVKPCMDTAGIAMWADAQLKHYVSKHCRGKLLDVWDSCGCHNLPVRNEIFQSINDRLENLPPNVTDKLQVVELVVNDPLLAGIIRERCHSLFEYMQSCKTQRLKDQVDKKALKSFDPPKPDIATGLRTVYNVEHDVLGTDTFKESTRKCFIAVVIAPKSDDKPIVTRYRDTKLVSLCTPYDARCTCSQSA